MISFKQFLLESSMVKIPISVIGRSPVSDSFNSAFSGLYIPETNTLIMFEYARHSTLCKMLIDNVKLKNKMVNNLLYDLFNKTDKSKYTLGTSYQIIFRDMGIISVSLNKSFHLLTISGKIEQTQQLAKLISMFNDETIITELGITIFDNGKAKHVAQKFPDGKNLPTTSFRLEEFILKGNI
jgi:hypothetical protein